MSRAARRLCMGAIVYNEAPYLLEWIAFHLEQGFEHFYIGDHDSDDGTTALLESLASMGFVTRIFHPRSFAANAQRNVYEQIVATTRSEHCLLALFDADEFLTPLNPDERAGDAIRELLEPWRNGALGINWRVFGSSGRVEPGEGLVIDRFTHCNEPDARINRHIKSVVKPECVSSVEVHRCRLRFGSRYVNSAGEPTPFDRTTGFARDIAPSDGRLRLNHYVVKSYREFVQRKAKRGRATLGPGNLRDRFFFRAHDKSGCIDLRAQRLKDRVAMHMEELRQRMAAAQHGRVVVSTRVNAQGARLEGLIATQTPLDDPTLVCTEYLDEGNAVECELNLRRINDDAMPSAQELPCRYAFDASLPLRAGKGGRHGHRLRLRGHPAVLLDARSPTAFLGNPVPASAAVQKRPWNEHVGRVDAVSQLPVISGWARHWDSDEPVIVKLFAGRRLIATQRADLARPDTVRDHQHPSGRCGFEFHLRELGIVASAACRVKVENSRFWLPQA